MLRVHLRRVLVVLGRMQRMPMRDFGMVCGLVMIAGFMMLRGLAMVLGGVLMVMCGLLVMLVNFVAIHRYLPGMADGESCEHCVDR